VITPGIKQINDNNLKPDESKMDANVAITIGIQILGLGVIIGMNKVSTANTNNRLQRIEDKQDKQNSETAEIRERLAVVESQLDIKRHK
jgi:hypothetical protein